MKPLPYLSSLVAAALVFSSGVAAVAQEGEPEVTLPPIGVTTSCDTSPERVTITNNTKKPLKLKRVGST